MVKIYHNPRCGKSRQTLKLIREKGIEPEVIEYLKTPLDEEELSEIVGKLGIEAQQLIRKGESIFKENYKGKQLAEAEWIAAMAKHPILMERPVVVNGEKAALGRPPKNVNDIL